MVLLDKAASFEVAVADLEEVWKIAVLHGAANRGLDVVYLLLEKGANVNAKDKDRGTALRSAASDKHESQQSSSKYLGSQFRLQLILFFIFGDPWTRSELELKPVRPP